MTDTTTVTTAPTVWPALRYRDARAAIRFLVEAFGFEESLVVPGERANHFFLKPMSWYGSVANPEAPKFPSVDLVAMMSGRW